MRLIEEIYQNSNGLEFTETLFEIVNIDINMPYYQSTKPLSKFHEISQQSPMLFLFSNFRECQWSYFTTFMYMACFYVLASCAG